MSDTVITVENLSKRYLISRRRSEDDGLRHVLEDAFLAPWRWLSNATRRQTGNDNSSPRASSALPAPDRSVPSASDLEAFWALRDVSLEVKQGEVIGIIGRNGAGKSTLLKVLSRITEPTKGRIRIKGRVASLLEVGTGFHQELTGRENIYLNGAILGMTRSEIRKKFDAILDFAEVDQFVDTPVKRYSSGMYVRLAFAVAAHLEPEILVVDEVLAVGDLQFQKKCLGRMRNVARDGRTVLFVSHNMQAVRTLCSRGLMLERGQALCDCSIEDAIKEYQRVTTGIADASWTRPPKQPESRLTFETVAVYLEGEQPNIKLHVRADLASHESHRPAFMAIDILDSGGLALMQAIPTLQGFLPFERRQHKVHVVVELPPLVPGVYGITLWVGPHNTETLHLVSNCAQFEILGSPTPNRTFPHTADHGFIVPRSALIRPEQGLLDCEPRPMELVSTLEPV